MARAAINCGVCGVLISSPSGSQMYCRTCSKERQRQRGVEHRKKMAEQGQVKTERAAINCAVCGVLITAPRGPQKYCRSCAYEAQKQQQNERAAALREPVKRLCIYCGKEIDKPKGTQKTCRSCREQLSSRPEREKERRVAPPPAPSGERWSLRGKDLTRVGVEANALGLTYGKYVSYIDTGFIDRHCLQQGIPDGPSFVKKAWEQFLREKKEKERAIKSREKVGGWNGRPW